MAKKRTTSGAHAAENRAVRMLREFTALRDALRAAKDVGRAFTVKTVELDLRPRDFDPEAVRLLRLKIGASQAVFASIVAVSPDLVAAWEQGNRRPSGMACRLLELIEADVRGWKKKLTGAMVGP